MQVVLFEPEIPPNTGNIARLCAATGVVLNLIEPLGFKLENRYLKRAGLDYWPFVQMRVWSDWSAFVTRAEQNVRERLVLTSAKQRELSVPLPEFIFQPEDCLVFGPETRGLPQNVLACSGYHLYIPMLAGTTRSLNLSTATGIVLYTALMQCHLTDRWFASKT